MFFILFRCSKRNSENRLSYYLEEEGIFRNLRTRNSSVSLTQKIVSTSFHDNLDVESVCGRDSRWGRGIVGGRGSRCGRGSKEREEAGEEKGNEAREIEEELEGDGKEKGEAECEGEEEGEEARDEEGYE